MPRDGWRKEIVRALAAATGRKYADAHTALTELNGTEGRVPRAARTFCVEVGDLSAVAAAACSFAGVAPPAGPLSHALVQRMMVIIDPVPLGVLVTRQDLYDAATPTGPTGNLPPIPDEVTDVLNAVDAEISEMPPQHLQVLAADLGLDVATSNIAAILTRRDRAADDEPDEASSPQPLRDVSDPRNAVERAQADAVEAAVLAALAQNPPAAWGPGEVRILRQAVRQLLAQLGDALLWASEWQPHPLAWGTASSGTDDELGRPIAEVAVRPVPGRDTPVQAHVLTARRPPPEDEPLFSGGPHAQIPAGRRWAVGWQDRGGQLRHYEGDTAPSSAAARYSAEVVVDHLVAHSTTARLPMSGELLVPRARVRAAPPQA